MAPVEIKDNETYLMLNTVNAVNNNNKFYEIELVGEKVNVRYGRIGTEGSRISYPGGRAKFLSVARSKMNKGYRKVDLALSINGVVKKDDVAVRKAALVSLGRSDTTGSITSLVDRLVDMNAHEIMEGSGGSITIASDGVIRTPLGIVSKHSIEKARNILPLIYDEKHNAFSKDLANDYLSLIPQKVSNRDDFVRKFNNREALARQGALLDQLMDSYQWAEAQREAALKTDTTEFNDEEYRDLFRYSIRKVEDESVITRIKKKYEATKNSMHSSRNLKLVNVYEIVDEENKALYNAKLAEIGNERELWHGTRAMNVLSILRKGLFVPPSRSGIPVTGRMFGDGVYFSDQSTKSLNYAYGGAPGMSRVNRSHSSYFMFLANVAMGWEYQPNRLGINYVGTRELKTAHTGTDPKTGAPYNSISIKGGTCGVRNNEMIVWNTDQINLRYLCEFQ